MPLAAPRPGGPRFADVLKMEEKGSEVNIATYMLIDAFRNDCDQLVVITNDSDLAEPVRIINKEMLIPVGIFNPQTNDTAVRRARITGNPRSPCEAKHRAKKSCEVQPQYNFRRTNFSHGQEPISPGLDRCSRPQDHPTSELVKGLQISTMLRVAGNTGASRYNLPPVTLP